MSDPRQPPQDPLDAEFWQPWPDDLDAELMPGRDASASRRRPPVRPMPRTLTAAAQLYAARSWLVFPVRSRSKVPATRRGLHDATSDPDTVSRWWRSTPEANIGVDCGRSGLLVVDLDGEQGIEAWADLAATAAPGTHAHEPTLVSRTGGGGMQLFFTVPDQADGARSTVGRLRPGIDTRGLGGYAVLPPSQHPSGRRYRWWTRHNELAPAPPWLAELMRDLRVVSPPPGRWQRQPLGQQATRYGTKALAGIVDEMRHAPESTRHNTLNRLAFRAGRLAAAGQFDRYEAERLLVDAALLTGLEQRDVTRTCRDGIQAGIETGPAQITRTPAAATTTDEPENLHFHREGLRR